MTHEERAFRDKTKGETELRAITDAELASAEDMPGTEFRAKKKRCLDFLNLCDQMISANEELSRSYSGSTDHLFAYIKEIKSVNRLHGLHGSIQKLYNQLRQYSGPPPPDGDLW